MSALVVSGVEWGSGRFKKYQKGCFELFLDLQTPCFRPGSDLKFLKLSVTWRHVPDISMPYLIVIYQLWQKILEDTKGGFLGPFSEKKCFCHVIEWRLNFLDFSWRSFLWWPGTTEPIEPEFTASKIISIILIYRPISHSIPQRFQINSCSVETSLSSNEKKILEPMGPPHIQRPLWILGQNWHFPGIFNRVARVKFF